MIEILLKEYKKHKKFVVAYVLTCAILAFVLGTGFVQAGAGNIFAAGTGGAVSTEDTLVSLHDGLLGNRLSDLAGDYSATVSVSAEPFSALLFLSIVANINKVTNNPLNLPSFPLDNHWILLTVALFFVASKFMKANSSTKVFGVCTLGYLERFLGLACILVIGVLSVTGVATMGAASVVEAANEHFSGGVSMINLSADSLGTAASASGGFGNIAVGILSSIFSAFMGFMSLIVNYIIRTVAKGIDAFQVIFTPVPFVSALCEAAKAALVFAICAINVFWPVAGYIINIIVFIICCVIFRACYYAAQYLEHIYFLPLMRKIFRQRDKVKLIPKRIPKRIRKALDANGIEPDFIIPVYLKRRHRTSTIKIRPLRKLYLIHSDKGTQLYAKKYMKQKDYFRDFDHNVEGGEILLNKGFTHYEIYSFIQSEKNLQKRWPTKDFTLVFAKDYIGYIDDIIRLTGYTDAKEQAENAKEERRREREERKALRRSRKVSTLR